MISVSELLASLQRLAMRHETTAAVCFVLYLLYDLAHLYITLTLGGAQ